MNWISFILAESPSSFQLQNLDIFSFQLDEASMKAIEGLARSNGRLANQDPPHTRSSDSGDIRMLLPGAVETMEERSICGHGLKDHILLLLHRLSVEDIYEGHESRERMKSLCGTMPFITSQFLCS